MTFTVVWLNDECSLGEHKILISFWPVVYVLFTISPIEDVLRHPKMEVLSNHINFLVHIAPKI